jgi:hypothetical protein
METLETPRPTEAPETTAKRTLPKPAILAGLGLAAVVTLYLLTMTVLWGLHHHSLTSARSDLTTELDAEQAIVASQTDELATLTDAFKSSLNHVSVAASDKAKYQDFTLLFRNNDEGLSECADARLELVGYVKSRYLWQPGPLHAWDNEVAGYCNTTVQYFTDNVDTEESS